MKLSANSFRSNAIFLGRWSSKSLIPLCSRIVYSTLIWVEFKTVSAFLILPHVITIGVNSLLNFPAKSSLKLMNFLLVSIIIYSYSYLYRRYLCHWDLMMHFTVAVLGGTWVVVEVMMEVIEVMVVTYVVFELSLFLC